MQMQSQKGKKWPGDSHVAPNKKHTKKPFAITQTLPWKNLWAIIFLHFSFF